MIVVKDFNSLTNEGLILDQWKITPLCCSFSTFLDSQLGSAVLWRSSRPVMFREKGVLRNFSKFTGKHLCQVVFFNKVAGPECAMLLKKRLWHSYFPVNFAKFLRASFLTKSLWLLLLIVICIVVANTIIIAQRCI